MTESSRISREGTLIVAFSGRSMGFPGCLSSGLSCLENGAESLRIGDHVVGANPAITNGEREDQVGSHRISDHDDRSSRQVVHARIQRIGSQRSGFRNHMVGTRDAQWAASRESLRVGRANHFGMEDGHQTIDIAPLGSGEKRGDHLPCR